ncbi:MAG: symmetrical bis(5'-nucleosyl)-tetraphosphatase [Mariprofundales bacterium]|nr:symmetrical bis(5'-nucleosyl)-tetraphosphatase [Mariprofundales bacterium]
MAIYAVGDIQGCYRSLRHLLELVEFQPGQDQLWCVGDLVNRGPDSLATLRLLRELGDSCIAVLGNHDLNLLQMAATGSPPSPALRQVIDASDCSELIEWLRHRPLLYRDSSIGWAMVHAGLHPNWTLKQAVEQAEAVTQQLRSDSWQQRLPALLKIPTTNRERDNPSTLAILTRSRFCTASGRFNWQESGATSANSADRAWFAHPQARWRCDIDGAESYNCRIVFGHWAARGVVDSEPHVLGLDSGCVWGNALTLARIDQKCPQLISTPCREQVA